jgi:hypothetical protein
MNNKTNPKVADPKAVDPIEEQKKQAYNKGLVVILLVATMTFGEFLVGYFASLWWGPLLAIAILKAFFILRDYMHIGRVFSSNEHEVSA